MGDDRDRFIIMVGHLCEQYRHSVAAARALNGPLRVTDVVLPSAPAVALQLRDVAAPTTTSTTTSTREVAASTTTTKTVSTQTSPRQRRWRLDDDKFMRTLKRLEDTVKARTAETLRRFRESSKPSSTMASTQASTTAPTTSATCLRQRVKAPAPGCRSDAAYVAHVARMHSSRLQLTNKEVRGRMASALPSENR